MVASGGLEGVGVGERPHALRGGREREGELVRHFQVCCHVGFQTWNLTRARARALSPVCRYTRYLLLLLLCLACKPH